MPVPTYADWMKRTSLTFGIRSPELKALDLAVLGYNEKKVPQKVLQAVFDAWKKPHGSGSQWRKDERNRSYAMDDIEMALTGVTYDPAVGPNEMPGMDNARQGVLYLFNRMHVTTNFASLVVEGGLGAGLALGDAGELATSIVGTGWAPGQEVVSAVESAALRTSKSPLDGVKAWLYELLAKLVVSLREKFGNIDVSLRALKGLIDTLAKAFLSKAAPFISAGLDLAKGLANTADAVVRKFKEWRDSFGVELLAGHPAIIVDSIRKAMRMSIYMGLFETVRGALALTSAILSAGGSALIDALTALATMLIKVLWRLFEILKMRQFFAEAKKLWAENHPAMRMRPSEFVDWYKKPAMSLPGLAIITLISGICGDKMRFLKVLTDNGQPMDANEFCRQAAYVDDLKRWGVDYLENSAYEFSSEDMLVEKLLRGVRANMRLERNFVWDGVLRFLRA